MADDTPRRPKGRGPRRAAREGVPADPGGLFGDDPDEDGSAGVREPRRPKPKGPVSGAAELPISEPPLVASLPDPRY
ncbi:MAG TPA: hypothetical protein VHW44_14455 [Pseudonocardiaceae bacterium]|nr:hypothetical protein [Pseudonocardiaceae bacterium]